MSDPNKCLIVYGQEFQYNDVLVMGTREALVRLLRQLGDMLEEHKNNSKSDDFFVNDGEGYYLRFVVVSEAEYSQLPEPYTDACAQVRRPKAWAERLRILKERVMP